MKTKLIVKSLALAWLVLATLNLQVSTVFAQGSLTPPGAPAPTMKTLDQVEPRTAITNLPYTISQSGSYYLTKTFAQTFSSDAITISTNNVTLDLCGFTIQQTGAVSAIVGIRLESQPNIPVKNALVKNGFISGFVSYGISCFGTRDCIFENLVLTECGGGVAFQAYGTAATVGNIVRHCHTCDNSGSGVLFLSGAGNIQNVIEYCDSLNNSSAGFSLAASTNLIINCRASGNANNYVIAAGNREGIIVQPTVNASGISGATGGSGTGTTDPYANLSF